MTNKKVETNPEDTKWFKRGFQSKTEYIGWLNFNDLIDESHTYDDTYYDQYTGKTTRLGSDMGDNLES